MAKSAIKTGVIGSWAFLIGVILAVVFGLISTGSLNSTIAIILVVIGIIVGILNVTDKEAMPFLMSGAVLIIASALGQNGAISTLEIPYVNLNGVLDALLVIFVPATIIVAIKNVFSLARN